VIIALLAGALSLGGGLTVSRGYSEPGAPVDLVARYEPESWRGDARWSTADKDEPGSGAPCCWSAGLTLDRQAGALLVGAGWTHRSARAWTKDRGWLRAGVAPWPWLRVVASAALTSRDRESRLDVAASLPLGPLLVEPSYGWALFDQGTAAARRRWAAAASLRVLWRLPGGDR
jgi:hypothetical protein